MVGQVRMLSNYGKLKINRVYTITRTSKDWVVIGKIYVPVYLMEINSGKTL